jgi:hypothetical protein
MQRKPADRRINVFIPRPVVELSVSASYFLCLNNVLHEKANCILTVTEKKSRKKKKKARIFFAKNTDMFYS